MRTLNVPSLVEKMAQQGAAIVISISGGKDSQAVLKAVVEEYQRRAWTGPLVAVHADLGRIEWFGTRAHIDAMIAESSIELHVVTAGDMVDRWKRRMQALEGTGKPFWSSSAHRYCTSDMKRTPIDKFLRRFSGLVISVDGVRAEESPARAKRPAVSVRTHITASRLRSVVLDSALELRRPNERLAVNWSAIHDWTLADVWEACGTSAEDVAQRREQFRSGQTEIALRGFAAHHAYVRGNQRLSCSLCVLATESDLRNGAKYHPEVALELVQMETVSGFTFKTTKSLASIIKTVLEVESEESKREAA